MTKSAMCGCGFVRRIWKKMGKRKRYTKEEMDAISKHLIDTECYWCALDMG
jgi:hypothetical protein